MRKEKKRKKRTKRWPVSAHGGTRNKRRVGAILVAKNFSWRLSKTKIPWVASSFDNVNAFASGDVQEGLDEIQELVSINCRPFYHQRSFHSVARVDGVSWLRRNARLQPRRVVLNGSFPQMSEAL